MPLFQNSVLAKYQKTIDKQLLNNAYALFKSYFHNATIQENIRNSKEEQFQEGFLNELFVKILGYTLNPNPEYNLITENKNIKDSKKADGAIIINNVVKAVIELKGTDTTDLGKIETQAFGYKNNQPECVYVITSNFEKLRFYIDNAIEYLEFNLFTLNQAEFELLYTCLAYQNILLGLPKKLKDDSIGEENKVTKKLYNDYSLFKKELYNNLVTLNPQFEPLELFKKSQKLLDRFLFLFFAEDRNLLPPNSVRLILDDWQKLQELDEPIPLYNRFKKYFEYLNTGFKGKKYDVFAYNGGLFKPDEVLDNILINDDLLFKHTKQLSEYDFESEIDVNILGHIFENSLNELDEIKAQLEGQEVDKTKTKRKKDGVFYTPKYITKYIVDNTVGKLCTEKKADLQLTETDYTTDKKRNAPAKKALLAKLNEYRNWLLQLTICDPACGSGAFLNQALDFLITEHRYIDELQAKLFGDAMVLSDVEKSILENNLFGVDLNEESVEIAKLSLWLRTAQPNRKLNDLNNNIKCGNSLIDDPSIAGEKAFNWQTAFPQVFDKGGFDVIIGNPPYATKVFTADEKEYYKNKFSVAQYQIDLYILFIELGVIKIKDNGLISYITPNSWLKNMNMSDCRLFVLNNLKLQTIIPNIPNAFSDAQVDSLIFIGKKSKIEIITDVKEIVNLEVKKKHEINQNDYLTNDKYVFTIEADKRIINILNKMNSTSRPLSDFFEITRGINPYDSYRGQSKEIIQSKAYHSTYKKDETFVPEIRGKHLNRYMCNWDGMHYISYGPWLAAPREERYFTGERIVFRQVLSEYLICTIIEEDFKIDQSVFIALPNSNNEVNIKYVLSLIASKLGALYFKFTSNEFDELFPKIKLGEFKNLPIKVIDEIGQSNFVIKADQMLSLNKELQELAQKFQRSIQRKFEIDELPKKLQDWYLLTYAEFIKELAKKKIKLSLAQEAEWEEYFTQEAHKALALKQQIDTTDKEIDQMVYKLYELTDEEIKIVEGE